MTRRLHSSLKRFALQSQTQYESAWDKIRVSLSHLGAHVCCLWRFAQSLCAMGGREDLLSALLSLSLCSELTAAAFNTTIHRLCPLLLSLPISERSSFCFTRRRESKAENWKAGKHQHHTHRAMGRPTPPVGVWLPWLCFLSSAVKNGGGAAFLPGLKPARRRSAPCFRTRLRSSSDDGSKREEARTRGKRIVLIRHGCTYMNEYLSQEGCRWGDAGFTDHFEEPDRTEMYQDSRLSPLGVWQAGELRGRLRDDPIVNEIDLVVCSPLTRALKTMDIALYPFIGIGDRASPPVLALPEASERVYLISDIGRPSTVLKQEFPYVDFDMCHSRVGLGDESSSPSSHSVKGAEDEEAWWWQQPSSSQSSYAEWRPSDAGQHYACPGEPQVDFERRMKGLYSFLHSREEQTIALVCHWGVVDWLIGEDFDNCEMRVVDFETDFRPEGFVMSDEDAAELFSEGERSVIANVDEEVGV